MDLQEVYFFEFHPFFQAWDQATYTIKHQLYVSVHYFLFKRKNH